MGKILVVDDSTTMRKIVMKSTASAAEAAGKPAPEFVEASDGAEGLEQLAKVEGIELVLCDINMPNMNGIEFVQCVRDQSKIEKTDVGDKALLKRVGNTVPIVMITTEGGLEKVQEALGAGANDFIKKPFTPDQIAEKLSDYIP